MVRLLGALSLFFLCVLMAFPGLLGAVRQRTRWSSGARFAILGWARCPAASGLTAQAPPPESLCWSLTHTHTHT